MLRRPSRLGKRILPRLVRRGLHMRLLRYNIKEVGRDPLNPALKQQVQAAFAPDVAQWSQLLDFDLRDWYNRW